MLSLKTLLISAALTLGLASADAQQLAFPGAAGWGRLAKGARASSTPTVYHVTNLKDSGTGSLRDAVSKPNRIVVFDVSGVIKISSRIVFSSNLYVAGQTAPGEGITVYGNGVSFSGASNIICRYLRVRMGHGGDSGKDCAGVANGSNMIFDHCSFSWGLDETFSINANNLDWEANITLQNCIFAQGILPHSAGGLMQAKYVTLYRNFYADNSTRNNKVKGINQYANNVVYNWQNGCYIMGGDSNGSSYCNIQSNLFVNGPAKGGNALGGGNSDFHFYGNDNWQDSNMDGKYNPSCIDNTQTGGGDKVATPFDYPELELYPGNELIERNMPTVGASLPYRDQADYYVIDELKSYGKKGSLITYETSLPIGAPDTWEWWAGNKLTDTDNDGMPDAWETANGTDPNKDDATVKAANGYLNIENYINSITADDRQYFLRKPVLLSLESASTTTMTLTWNDYTYGEEGFAIEIEKDGTWQEVGRTAADATEYKIEGLEEATKYNVRVYAFGKNNGADTRSEYATGAYSTRQTSVGILDIDSYEPDVTNTTDVAEGQKLLLTTDATLDYNIPAAISPASVVVKGNGTVTISGEAISGAASMNKADKGTLIINNKNSYKGATVLHGGTLEFNSLTNGSEPSAIGASISDPANWIMDGGTYRYTGGSTTTDRGARIISPTTLDIANGATITENGSFEGTSDLTLDGNGTLSIADAANFFKYTGSTVLNGGTLYLSDVENASKIFGGLGRKVVMNGGTLQFNYKKDDSQTLTFPIEVKEGTTSTIKVGTTGTFRGNITGSGTLIMELPYLRFTLGSNLPNFTGRLVAKGTPMSGTALAMFYPESQFNSPKVVFDLTGKCYMAAWTTNAVNVIGGLSGDAGTYLYGSSKQTKGFKCSWEVGGANTDETFRGIINNLPAGGNSAYSGTTSIKKVGTGYWRLTGNNVYSGTTEVTGGTLIIDGTHSGTGAVTLSGTGTTLKGQGSIAGSVTAGTGTIVEAGDTIAYGKSLTFKGALTMNAGSTLRIPLYSNSSSYSQNNIKVTGKLTIGNNVNLELDTTNLSKAIAHGTEFVVFGQVPSSVSGNFAAISPEVPAEGLVWDTSELYTTGKIIAKKPGEPDPDPDPKPEKKKRYVHETVYSWESPDGTPVETGGSITMENAPADVANRVNYQNSIYYTLSLNGKYGNRNDATPSNNSTYIKISLNEPIAIGDSISVTAFRNKDTDANACLFFDYGTATFDDKNTTFGNIATGGVPTTNEYRVPDGAENTKVIKLTRGSVQGTNLFITKFKITRCKEIEVLVGDANGDDQISVADLSMIASYILGEKMDSLDLLAADVNDDGSITVADLSMLASIILGQ